MKKDLFNGNEFFKSASLAENGRLIQEEGEDLQKSIPTVQGKLEVVQQQVQKKTVPVEVVAFKKKVEAIFAELNEIVADLIKGYDKPERCADMLKAYKDFKQEFSWKLNDAINYPKNNNGDVKTVAEEGEWEKSRVNLDKVKDQVK